MAGLPKEARRRLGRLSDKAPGLFCCALLWASRPERNGSRSERPLGTR